MRLTISQLRRIIKEEVSSVANDPEMLSLKARRASAKADVSDNPSLHKAAAEAHRAAQAAWEEISPEELAHGSDMADRQARKHAAQAFEHENQVTRNSFKESVRNGVRKPARRLSEAHARITAKELAAWSNGDWGYISESDEEEY